MHSSLMAHSAHCAAFSLMLVIGATAAPAQIPVVGSAAANVSAMRQAEALLHEGRRADAKLLLGQHLATAPNDGRSWFALGRIHLGDAQAWHRDGHPAEVGGVPVTEFATSAFDQAHHLLADSASVYLVLAIVERTTSRIERLGWAAALSQPVPPEELPLPPVLVELGRNLMGSCPRGGVLVTGSIVEMAAVWGVRLLGEEKEDLILIRPDLYAYDSEYRGQMATTIGADPALPLAAALVRASARRPVCLAPSADSIPSESLDWHPVRLVLAAGPTATGESQAELSVHHLARTGLAGSVWSAAARDIYDLAARRNRLLCRALFDRADALGLPTIASCLP